MTLIEPWAFEPDFDLETKKRLLVICASKNIFTRRFLPTYPNLFRLAVYVDNVDSLRGMSDCYIHLESTYPLSTVYTALGYNSLKQICYANNIGRLTVTGVAVLNQLVGKK